MSSSIEKWIKSSTVCIEAKTSLENQEPPICDALRWADMVDEDTKPAPVVLRLNELLFTSSGYTRHIKAWHCITFVHTFSEIAMTQCKTEIGEEKGLPFRR